MQTKGLFLGLFIFFNAIIATEAQNRVVISDKDGQEPHESAILDLISSEKGFLLPRMDESNRNNIDGPGESLLIFNDDTKCVETYIDTEWHEIWCFEAPEPLGCTDVAPPIMDGHTYDIIGIGDQCWFAENLKTTIYNDDTPIPLVEDEQTWRDLESDAYCWFDNDISNKDIYGGLYNWYVVETEKICPDGWSVPTDDDWKILEMELGMSQEDADDTGYRGTSEGSKLAGNVALWEDGELNSHDDFGLSGFNALPGGFRHLVVGLQFRHIEEKGYWWTSTVITVNMRHRDLHYDYTTIQRGSYGYNSGLSIRCIKDR